jgi:glycosyltransferase involved in cell wall biosynthesis
MIKVSVIVPVYNVEPYLRKCLDSLVNQTLKDIEIICINDCSPDNSLIILKEFAKKDKRIRIIDFKKNQGVSVARNAGMKIASGEYFAFVDPDDYIDLDFYEKLYKLAKHKNADIAKAIRKKTEIGSDVEFIEDENMNKRIRKNKCHFIGQFTTAIYRSKILKIHRVKFPVNVMASEDCCFTVHAVIVAKNIYFLNDTAYHYIRREHSGNSETYSYQKAYSYLRSHSLMLSRINKVIEKDKHYFDLYKCLFYNILILLLKNSEEQTVKKVAEIAIKHYQKCRFPRKLNLPKQIIAAIKAKNKKELSFLLLEWKNNECYPEIDIKESVLQNRKIYVWGAGADASRVQIQCERNNWKISNFLDYDKNIKEFSGYKVKKPKQILEGK